MYAPYTDPMTNINREHYFDAASATAILEANDVAWTDPAIDVADALAEAGWSQDDIDEAISLWLR